MLRCWCETSSDTVSKEEAAGEGQPSDGGKGEGEDEREDAEETLGEDGDSSDGSGGEEEEKKRLKNPLMYLRGDCT